MNASSRKVLAASCKQACRSLKIGSRGIYCGVARQANVTLDNINENVIKLEYAVRGPLVIRAGEIERELKVNNGSSRPFASVTRANIGDWYLMRSDHF